jgi:hypothetical protein
VSYPGYRPRLLLRSFNELPQDARAAGIARIVDALARIDQAWLALHPEVPSLYESGVRYKERGLGLCGDDWRDIPEILKEGGSAVCEDLTAWRIAELREAGENVQPVISTTEVSKDLVVYHVRVLRANGQIEDPSLILGMQPRMMAAGSVSSPEERSRVCSPSSCWAELH